MTSNTPLRAAFAAATLAGLSACETGIDVPISLPAQSTAAAQLRTIAVLDFQGADGANYATALEATLTQAVFDQARYFNVISRQSLAGRTGISGSSDAAIAAAIRYGAEIGVDAVYFGDVTNVDVSQTSQTVEKSRCVEFDGPFDCERREQYNTVCYTTNATYTVVPKVASVATGVVVYSDTLTGTSSSYHCQEDTNPKTRDALLAEARTETLGKVRNAVAPRNGQAKVDLVETATLGDRQDQAAFDGAVAFAKAGRMDRACGAWELLLDTYPTTFEILYNTAVCAEVSGDFSRALDMYGQLDAGLVTPNKKVTDALARVRGQIQAQGLVGG